MEKIKWCFKQKAGIKIIEPNERISEEYLKESSEDFEMITKSNPKWRVISSYYSCYNALYSILMKCGLKCEIHDCSLELMRFFDFTENEIDFLNNLKEERINVQYYLKNPGLNIKINSILEFTHKCKNILISLNDNKINEIRKKLKEVANESKI